jgi:hypothetical protein
MWGIYSLSEVAWTTIVFAEEGDESILGLHALEILEPEILQREK